MTQEYSFVREDETRIAHHRDDPTKDIKLNSDWIVPEEDTVYAPWEDLIEAIVSENLTEYIDISSQDQVGSMPLEQAGQNLVDGIESIESERHARALLECLAAEEKLDIEGDEVVLFKNPAQQETMHSYLYNWAAAINATTSKIEEQIERAQAMDDRLEKKLDQIDDIGPDLSNIENPQEQINRIDRKLRALGDSESDSIPNPDDLSPEEQRRFQQLHRSSRIARSRIRLRENISINTDIAHGDDIEDLMSGEIENFQRLQRAFVEYEKDLRTVIAYEDWEANGVTDLLDNLVDMLSGIALIDQSIEDEDYEELDETMTDLRDYAEEANESREQIDAIDNDPEGKRDEVEQEMSTDEEFQNSLRNNT